MLNITYMRELNIISIIVRVILAMLIGGILGFERGRKKRPAGFRTYMLVCLGSSLVMMTNQYTVIFYGSGDPVRLGAQVISGIGFLGAGTIILTGRNHVRGITTAAGLWTAACSGLAIGIGFYEGAVIGGISVFIIMSVMQSLDEYIHSHTRIVEIYAEFEGKGDFKRFSEYLSANKLEITDMQLSKNKLSKVMLCMVLIIRSIDKHTQAEMLDIIQASSNLGYIEKL